VLFEAGVAAASSFSLENALACITRDAAKIRDVTVHVGSVIIGRQVVSEEKQ
jgi:imidazolonepropionase-like amidohydrolase